jgi:chromosome segregation ATPase
VEELTNLRTGLEEAQVATLEEAAELKVLNRSLFIRNAHLEDTMAGVYSAIAKVAAALGIDVQLEGQQVYSEEVLKTLVTSAETAAASGGKARALEEQLEAAAGAMEVSEEQRLEAQQAAQGLQETLAAMEQKMAGLQKALSAQHDAHTHVEAERVALEGKLEAMVAQLATAREQLQMLSEQVEALGRDAGAGESEREQRLQKVQAQLALALASQESKNATVEALQQEHKSTLAAAAALEAGKEAVEEELLLAKTRQREAEQLRDKALADLQKVKEALEKEQRKCKETTLLNKQLHKQFKKSFEDFLITSPQQLTSGTPAKPYYKDADSVLKVSATPNGKENSGEDAACVEDGASQGGGRKVLMQIENLKGSGVLRGPTPAKGRARAGSSDAVDACRKGIISFAELSDEAENQGSGDTRVVSPVSFN